jgi:hypothetical protein
MFLYLMADVSNRHVTVSDENEGPVVNIAAVRCWTSRCLTFGLDDYIYSRNREQSNRGITKYELC